VPVTLDCPQCPARITIRPCPTLSTRWPCGETWQVRAFGWYKEKKRHACGSCCRRMGDGYYEGLRLKTFKDSKDWGAISKLFRFPIEGGYKAEGPGNVYGALITLRERPVGPRLFNSPMETDAI